MRRAQTYALNQAWRIAELSTVRRIPDRVSQQRGIKDEGLRETVAAEDCCLIAHNIIDFSVGAVAIKKRCAAADEVAREVRCREHLRDLRLQQLDHRRCRGINAIGTDNVQYAVAGDLLFSLARCVASRRIKNFWISRQISKVPRRHCSRGQCSGLRPSQLPLRRALVIDEEEQLIFLDGSAEGAAKLVLVVPVLVRELDGIRLEVVARRKILVKVEFMGAAVK